jgi:Spy/CpxP family protein refolding chaperone
MRVPWIRPLLAVLLLAAGAQPAGAAQGYAWWKSEQLKKEIGLTDEQSARIEAIVQSTLPTLRNGKNDLDRQEAELSRLIEINADEAQVVKQIEYVESIRAFLNKTRTLMLLRERQVMTPEQRVAFKAFYERTVQERRRRDGERRTDGDRRPDGQRRDQAAPDEP